MKTLHYIDTQEAADALPKVIAGTDRNTDIGLHVHVPTPDKIILPHNILSIENVFIPVMKTGFGEFEFKDIRTTKFGGDNFNIRGNGNVKGNRLRAWNNTPTRPYGLCTRKGLETIEECLDRHGEVVYDPALLAFEMWKGKESIIGYHVDGILQVYATPSVGYPAYDNLNRDPEGGYGSIANIDIANIDADLYGTKTQGIAGTEKCSYYNIRIGYESFRVITDGYPYHTLFNTLEDSSIGCSSGNQTNAKLWISQSKDTISQVANNVYPGFEPNQIVGDVSTMKPEQFESNVRETSLPSFTVIPHDLSIAQFAFEYE